MVAGDGNLDAEITHRVQSGWNNWRKTSWVLCDRKINVKIKGIVYNTVVRPAMLYGAESSLIVEWENMWKCGIF